MITTSRKSEVRDALTEWTGGQLHALLGGLLSEAFANLECAPAVQKVNRHASRNLLGARASLTPEEGRGHFELMQMGVDMYVITGDLTYKDSRVELVQGDGLIQFYFQLSGDLTLEVSGSEPLRLNRPSLLIYRRPRGIDVKAWTAPNALERWVAITLRAKFLVDNFFSPGAAVPSQLSALVSDCSSGAQYCRLPLSARMFELATRLVDNSFTGSLALVYAEALALELLCSAVASLDAVSRPLSGRYSERELRCLNTARGLVMKQLSPAPTIRQIARAAGLNETSLKRGFRELFGETVFDFSVRCRMQRAMLLLREKRVPVAQVAEAVGYSHQTSFAAAFRRHYGLCPKDTRPLRAL